jgi:signal transduction histidine kinase
VKPRFSQSQLEWGFLALMLALCGALSVLQYRWTGELGRAEMERMRAGLQQRVDEIAASFDRELGQMVTGLIPRPEELDELGFEQAHAVRFSEWNARRPRPAFSRIAVAVPRDRGVALFEMDKETGRLSPIEWPSGWQPLKSQFEAQAAGARVAPMIDPRSTLIEVPVFGRSERLVEREWLVFELDLNYVRNNWMRDLLARYLYSGGEQRYELEVRQATRPEEIIFSTLENGKRLDPEVDATAQMFPIQPAEVRGRGPRGRGRGDFEAGGPEGPPPGRPPMRRGEGPGGRMRWVIAASHPAGSLAEVVERARWRNLAVALVLTGFVLASGLALLRFTRRSRELAEMQLNFVAGVSHELRTPLTVIRGAGHNLQRGVVRDPAQVENYAGLIVKHADQLTDMVEQLLSFSSARRKGPVSREAVPLAPLVQEVLDANAAELSGVDVQVDVPDRLAVSGEPASLKRVLLNLVGNAAKHARSGRWLSIGARADGGSVYLRFTDRGPGIDREDLPRIFDPFYRGERARAEQIRGSGLGLSLVKEIVEAHGGIVSVESHEGQGAVFTVRLPEANA